jgi:hypothetical protein
VHNSWIIFEVAERSLGRPEAGASENLYALSPSQLLRHTFASRLVMAGVDLRTVQELMGHKCIQMTVRYSHLAPKHTLAAVELLGATSKSSSTGTRTSTEGVQGDGEEVSHAF